MLPAAIVLSIMILPTITAISRDALVAVPPKLREAAYGLGATRWESHPGRHPPDGVQGIFGAVILAFGRALGETMALAMLVGNANRDQLGRCFRRPTLWPPCWQTTSPRRPKEIGGPHVSPPWFFWPSLSS